MLSSWLSPPLAVDKPTGQERDGKTGLKGKAPLWIRRLVRVPWLVPGEAVLELVRKGHVDNRGYAWRAASGIWLLGKGRKSPELASVAVQGLPAHPSPGSIVPGCHPQPLAVGLFLQLCLCFLISPFALQKS